MLWLAAADMTVWFSSLGGPEVAGIGFAIGVERLLVCLSDNKKNVFQTDLFIAALGERAQKMAFRLT